MPEATQQASKGAAAPPKAEPATPLFRGIFHVHTNASPDAAVTPAALVERCLDHGVDLLAVTDHNEIAGAVEVQRLAPFQVIVGEEIRTAEGGEVVGLFLKEKIARGLPAREVIRAIRAQRGLVYFPHPYDTIRVTAWPAGVVEPLLPEADIIEVYNARNIVAVENARAADAARRLNIAPCAGADAHTLAEIGRTVVFLPSFDDPPALLRSLRSARFQTQAAPFWLSLRKRWKLLTRNFSASSTTRLP